MPNGMQMLDSGLPRFTGTENTEDKVAAIQNYLFMLLEELRYILQNLGTENFNAAELDGLKTEIRNAVKIDLSSGGDMATIQVDLAGLHTSIRNAEGNISTLEQTAQEIRTEVAGKINGTQAQTLISQNLNSITLSASDGDNQSTISIYANGIFVDSVIAKFRRLMADSVISGDGHYEFTSDDSVTNSGLILNYIDPHGNRQEILRVYYDDLGRVTFDMVGGTVAYYGAPGAGNIFNVTANRFHIENKFTLGSGNYGTQSPITRGIEGVEGMLYYQVVG